MITKNFLSIVVVAALGATLLGGCSGREARKEQALAKGQQYLAEQDYPKARVEFDNALQIDPNDADALYLLGVAAEKSGDLRTAARGYRAALNVDAKQSDARAALGKLYAFGGLAKQALDLVKPGLATDPGHAGLLTVRAAAEVMLGDEDAALADASAVVAAHPDDEQAIALVAGIYRNRKEFPKAVQLLEGAVGRLPSSADLRTVLAQIYASAGDPAKAEAQLLRVVELRPDDAASRQRLAGFYASNGRLDEAERTLRELVERDPESVADKLTLVDFLAARRSFDAAEHELVEFVHQAPKDPQLRLALGRFYEANHRPKDAERTYREVVDAEGEDAAGTTARDRLAALLVKTNRAEEGEKLIEQVLAKSPRDNEALILRAGLEMSKHRVQEAITDLRAVLRDQPDSAAVLRALAQAEAENDQPDLAREDYQHAIEANPADQSVRVELAAYLGRQGETDDARRLLKAVLDAQPDNLAALETQFKVQATASDWKGAEATAEAVRKLDPERPTGYYLEGERSEAAGDLKTAAGRYGVALEKSPGAAEPLVALTRVLLRSGDRAAARARLDQVLKKFPGHSVALNLLAELELSDKKPDEARAAAERAIKAAPSWWVPYRTKALALLAAGQTDAAVQAYVDGMKATHDAAGLGVGLAELYQHVAQPEKAIAVYERLHDANPSSEPVSNNLAMLLATYRHDQTSYARAYDLVRVFRDSEKPAFLNTYGWVRYRQGQVDEALTYLRRAASAAPDDPVMRYHLGMALLADGDTAEARAALETAVHSDKPFAGKDEARDALQKLNRG